MKEKKTKKIDLSRKRVARLADDFYNKGEYLSALRFAYRELKEYGGDPDVYARLCDIYEGMGLHGSAINYWFKLLDEGTEEDLPDVYEGLAANYLAIGSERQAAYYYQKLIEADENIPEEAKMDIAAAFSESKKEKFRFLYPPELADYSKEMATGSHALKTGDIPKALEELDKVAKGSKEYASAKEMQAVAHLLAGNSKAAEEACFAVLKDNPDEVRVLSTLAAVYLEQGREDESLAIAKRLAEMQVEEQEDAYKIATVCCENGLHAEAYRQFAKLEEKMPYDGKTTYFRGVSAYKSGNLEEALRAFDKLCTVYPDAEVAKFYLRQLREYQEGLQKGENPIPPELIYFYHLPQEEREERCKTLLKLGSCPKDEAQLFGLLALHDGYFAWCFDEMDGADRDLQYLGLVTAAHVRADEFLQDVLLDFEVADVLKVETLRMLIERNEDMDVGMVLCHIYRRVLVNKICIGRKRRKKFIEGYARVASKFLIVNERYTELLQETTERLYDALEKGNGLDLVDNPDDIACAVYRLAGLQELVGDQARIAVAFDANLAKVNVLLSYAITETEEKKDEVDGL